MGLKFLLCMHIEAVDFWCPLEFENFFLGAIRGACTWFSGLKKIHTQHAHEDIFDILLFLIM